MSSSTVTYTSISSDSDLQPLGFPLMDLAEFEALEEALQSPKQAPPSPDYVPGLEHPPSPDYVHGPEYPAYVAPSNDEIPIEDQPLPADASPATLSSGYEEEEESSEDDDDDEEEEEEASEEDEDEEEEHLAPADSAALPVIDPVPSTEEIEPFETDESAATPPPPRSP
ncbi:hypothetical protein Tco_0169138 [Tanacetum coccineum]